MKHRVGFNPLGRKTSHRKALHRNMVTSLFRYERITTTKAKARAVRRTAEKMITRAKLDTVHNRRLIAASIWDKAIVAKLFTDIGPRFETRPGGYTRMLKIGTRQNDAAEMVILELVGNEPEAPADKKKKAKAAKADKSPQPKGDSVKDKAAEKKTAEVEKKVEAAVEEPAAAEDLAAQETTQLAESALPEGDEQDTASEDSTDEKA